MLAPHAQLNQDDIVIVIAPSYLKNFEALISTTSKRVQANYALWRAIVASVDYLTDDVRKKYFKFQIESSGLNENTERIPRWEECVNIVSDKLDISVGSMYVRKHFKEDKKRTILEMVNDIKKQFTKIFKNVRSFMIFIKKLKSHI